MKIHRLGIDALLLGGRLLLFALSPQQEARQEGVKTPAESINPLAPRHPFIDSATAVALAQCLQERIYQLKEAEGPMLLKQHKDLPVTLEQAHACINILHYVLENMRQALQAIQQHQALSRLDDQPAVEQAVTTLHEEVFRRVEEDLEITFEEED